MSTDESLSARRPTCTSKGTQYALFSLGVQIETTLYIVCSENATANRQTLGFRSRSRRPHTLTLPSLFGTPVPLNRPQRTALLRSMTLRTRTGSSFRSLFSPPRPGYSLRLQNTNVVRTVSPHVCEAYFSPLRTPMTDFFRVCL